MYYVAYVSPRDKVLTFRPDEDMMGAMTALWERDGVSYSEQIRRALRAWLEEKNVLEKKVARKRAAARKRA